MFAKPCCKWIGCWPRASNRSGCWDKSRPRCGRFAAATRLVLQAEAARRRIALRDTLQQAGIKPFVLKKAERQLKLLGRRRGAQLYRWLLQADLDLKGESSMPPRLILERLIVRLAAKEEPAARR